MTERATLAIIGLTHDLENFIVGERETWASIKKHKDPDDDEDDDNDSGVTPEDILTSLERGMSALLTLGPMVKMIEDYLCDDVSDPTFRKRWKR